MGAFEFNLRFPGQIYFAETGLNYNYYRDYDPGTGRYVQSDPIGQRGGINTYSYAHGNPISNIDTLGLATWKVLDALEVGMAVGIGAQYLNIKLQSPCSDEDKRYTITVHAVGPSAGAGLSCKMCWTSPAKVSLGDNTFNDGSISSDLDAFNGPFIAVSAGVQFLGLGDGYGEVVLGRARSGRVWGWTLGTGTFGAEVTGTIGTSTVMDTKTEECNCGK